MAKSYFKDDSKILLAAGLALLAIALFFVYKRREGFQNAPSMPATPAAPAAPAAPSATNIDLSKLTSGSSSPDADTPRNTAKNTPSPKMPLNMMSSPEMPNPKIATVKAKVAELKGLIDGM